MAPVLETMNPVNKKNGIILIVAIFIVFLISTLGIGYLAVVNSQMEAAASLVKSTKAFYWAESGIADAILVLKNKPDWSIYAMNEEIINFEESNGSGYRVKVAEGLVPPSENKIKVESTGKFSNFQRIIQVSLIRTADGIITQQDWKEV